MRKTNRTVGIVFSTMLLLLTLSLHSCKQRSESKPDQDNHAPAIPKSIDMRAAANDELSTRFLGRGFNLSKYWYTDQKGMSRTSILDRDLIESGTPWNPWGDDQTVLRDVYAPEYIVEDIVMDPQDEDATNITESFNASDLNISLGASYKPVSVSANYSKSTEIMNNTYVYRSHSYKLYSSVSLDYNIDDLKYFLRRRFVNDLKQLSAKKLVEKYGTHLVLGYNLGAMSDFYVIADASIFSENETKAITASAFDIAKMDASLKTKISNNESSLKILYAQGGSNYIPENFISSFTTDIGNVVLVDRKEWKKQLRGNDGTFHSLSQSKEYVVPIPNIIGDFGLKLKYTSGILHNLSDDGQITYVLCDPDTYNPIFLNGDPMKIMLDDYESKPSVMVNHGGVNTPVTEHLISGNGLSKIHAWSINSIGDGTFEIKSPNALYLCRDLKLRKLSDDPDGKRFWLLNPIIPSDQYYYHYAWNRRLINLP